MQLKKAEILHLSAQHLQHDGTYKTGCFCGVSDPAKTTKPIETLAQLRKACIRLELPRFYPNFVNQCDTSNEQRARLSLFYELSRSFETGIRYGTK
jgi:hypothetical protein